MDMLKDEKKLSYKTEIVQFEYRPQNLEIVSTSTIKINIYCDTVIIYPQVQPARLLPIADH